MRGRWSPWLVAIAAAAVGAVTVLAAQGAGAAGALAAPGLLLLAWGRTRAWSFTRWLDRPRLLNVVSGVYLPFFFADLFVHRGNPVAALVRLILFLLAGEVVSGDMRHPHRPVLFGLLLMMGGAAETTEFWFALPVAVFTVMAVTALVRASLPTTGGITPPRARAVMLVVAGALCLGTVLFAIIPRAGAGWGRQTRAKAGEAGIETGLAEAVDLGTVGRVKSRTTVAFRGKLDRSTPVKNLEAIYWRAHVYSVWTGRGWARDRREETVFLPLPPDEIVACPGWDRQTRPALLARIDRVRTGPTTMLSSARPLWVRAPRGGIVVAGRDGTLRGVRGRTPRRYDLAMRLDRDGTAGEMGEDDVLAHHTDAGDQPPVVLTWANGIAPEGGSPRAIARAFVERLQKKDYSLDTRLIDPARPIASFLEGAPAHCEYFASAMAIGLRLRGVPARVVGGYLGADPAPFGRGFVVRDARAHLWVEAHLPGTGWVEFDPTPPAGRIPLAGSWPTLRSVWEGAILAWDAYVIGLDLGDQYDLYLTGSEALAGAMARVRSLLSGGGVKILGIGAGLLAVALFLAWWLTTLFGRTRDDGDLPGYYRRLLVLAAGRGLEPAPAETAGEFAVRAGRRLGDRDAVALLSRHYEMERFGGRPPAPAEAGRIEQALARIAAAR